MKKRINHKSYMKVLILIFIFFFSITFSQDFQFEEVVKVDSTTTKDELFNRARSWIGRTYNDEKYVIATEDRNNGELSGNGITKYITRKFYFGVGAVMGHVDYKINIFVKDGRYKYHFHSFRHTGTDIAGGSSISYGMLTNTESAPRPSRGAANDKAWKDIREKTTLNIQMTIQSLKEAMNKPYEASKDW